MADSSEVQQVLDDYACFVKALLPAVAGLHCHDENGRLLWSAADGQPLPPEHAEALETLVAGPDRTTFWLRASGSRVCLVPLKGKEAHFFGVLTLLFPSESSAGPLDISVLKPVLRSLQRDLALRVRLLNAHRRLSVQAAEEKLLHEVEMIGHERRSCETVLRRILERCQSWLAVDTVGLILPDQRIRLLVGAELATTDLERILESLPSTVEESGSINGPADVRERHADLLCLPLMQGGRRLAGVMAMAGWERSGFSERRRARIARYVASHIEFVLNRDFDPLTGLVAWPIFEGEIEAARQPAQLEPEECTVMYLDIDRLHVVNETLGRDAGDEILVRFAALARDNLAGHLVTRIASNSFGALLRGVSPEAALIKAQAICDGFREVIFVRGEQTYRPSVSIGVGPLAGEAESGNQGPLSTAQVACQAAKEHGRGRVELYESGDESIVRRLDDIHLVGFVRSAIERDRLMLMAQPIHPLKPEVGTRYFEVLVRMLGASGQYLSPSEFLSTAERYQMMEELDRWVVSRSLELIAAQGDALKTGDWRFAINLSGQSLGSDQFLPFVSAELARSGVPPGMISFEITESVAVTRMQQAQAFMHTLQRAGCRFSLDDFGTGLASFAYLKLFPVDSLKIDGSFIRDVVTNVVSQSMVAAIAEVARVMKLETVAEFVQDEQALRLLRDLGINWAQGFLLGVPRPLTEVLGEAGSGAAPALQATAL